MNRPFRIEAGSGGLEWRSSFEPAEFRSRRAMEGARLGDSEFMRETCRIRVPAAPGETDHPRMVCLALLGLLALGACGGGPAKGPYDTDPKTPEEAIQSFQLQDGFHVELVAAEPQVVDPVDIAFDENGDLWVAEMLDYPFDPNEGESPRSRIRFLEDRDGDGVYETATIFADQLPHVSSVLPWKGGVLAGAAPDIFFFKDTDGDRKADLKQVLFTGFDDEVSPEARVNNLRYGIDNWIYAANSGRPGAITSPRHPDKPGVVVRGYDFRFRPGTDRWEPAAGGTQFGMSFDEWGNRSGSRNTIFLSHAVLPATPAAHGPQRAHPLHRHTSNSRV